MAEAVSDLANGAVNFGDEAGPFHDAVSSRPLEGSTFRSDGMDAVHVLQGAKAREDSRRMDGPGLGEVLRMTADVDPGFR